MWVSRVCATYPRRSGKLSEVFHSAGISPAVRSRLHPRLAGADNLPALILRDRRHASRRGAEAVALHPGARGAAKRAIVERPGAAAVGAVDAVAGAGRRADVARRHADVGGVGGLSGGADARHVVALAGG